MTVLAVSREVEEKPRELPPSMIERMTMILEVFESPTTRLTLEQVSRATHLPRSTAHRILDQLVRLEWLSHSSFGYALGARSLGLGGAGSGHLDLREASADELYRLQVTTGLVVHLAVLDHAQVHYLDKLGGRFAGSVPTKVGGHAPAYCTALGKSMLAWLAAEEVDELLVPLMVGDGLQRRTPTTLTTLPDVHHELSRIRQRNGLAFERGECYPEFGCVAAAVRGPEGPIGAISLVGSADAPLERVAPLVVDAARRVSQRLFPQFTTSSSRTKGWPPSLVARTR